MNIKDLKSTVLRKKLGAESVRFRWHNKNKSGGNFGINIRGVKEKNYEILGRYNPEGLLRSLHFGYLFKSGTPMNVNSLEEMFEFINKTIESWS